MMFSFEVLRAGCNNTYTKKETKSSENLLKWIYPAILLEMQLFFYSNCRKFDHVCRHRDY